jgi:hypothetical protein
MREIFYFYKAYTQRIGLIPLATRNTYLPAVLTPRLPRPLCKSHSMHDSAISETDIRRVCRKVRRNIPSCRGQGRGAPYGTPSSSLPTTFCQGEVKWICSFALAPGVGQINANAHRICPWVQERSRLLCVTDSGSLPEGHHIKDERPTSGASSIESRSCDVRRCSAR